jgi:hypothetical protein
LCDTAGVKIVPLRGHQGYVSYVDDADYEAVKDIAWYGVPTGDRRTVHAQGVGPSGRPVYMHRLILGHPDGPVDHHNRNGLDNQRANLRLGGHLGNARNRAKSKRDATCKYKGVSAEANGRFRARIMVQGKARTIGTYGSPEDAARAYDAEARRAFGEWGRYNFPQDGELSCLPQ